MIAEQMHGFQKILINPEFIFPQGTCSDSNQILDNQFKGITEFDIENTYAFISDEGISSQFLNRSLICYELQ